MSGPAGTRGTQERSCPVDPAEGKRRIDEIGAKLRRWGCTADDQGERKKFHCGSWEASVSNQEIIHDVIIEAAESGAPDCK
jgi:hypothetical protein